MSKKETRPALIIQHILTPRLKQDDFRAVMKYVRSLERSKDQWKINYSNVKSNLSPRLVREDYQRVVKALNVLVRPYRETA